MLHYEITVEGHLHPNRLKQFEGFEAAFLPDGQTRLTGGLPDQAALFSVLNRIRDMNLPLISVARQAHFKEETP